MTISRSSLLLGTLAAVALFGAGCQPAAPTYTQPAATTPTPVTTPPPGTTIPTPTPTPTQTPTPAPKPTTSKTTTAPKTVTVLIQGMAFSPQIIAVSAGDTVKWTNKDAISHTSASDGTIIWDSGNISPGGSFTHTFKSVGSYGYHCGIHPSMIGTVIVR